MDEQKVPAAFRLPRWTELPGLALYLDQVLLVLEETLAPVTASEGGVITATIINNYVKQKLLAPTTKKKYPRELVADLIVLALLKRVLSTREMALVLAQLKEGRSAQQAYDLFCGELEAGLAGAGAADEACPVLPRLAIRTLADKILFDLALPPLAQ